MLLLARRSRWSDAETADPGRGGDGFDNDDLDRRPAHGSAPEWSERPRHAANEGGATGTRATEVRAFEVSIGASPMCSRVR